MRDWLQRRFILPTALVLRGETAAYGLKNELTELEFDRPRIDSTRELRLRELLQHATSTTPFYRRVSMGAEQGLRGFPILEKNDLFTHASELRSTTVGRATPKTTGGSTGRAVTVWKNPDAIAAERAATWMAFGWYGIVPGDRAIRFWGTGGSGGRRLRARLADLAMNRRILSAFSFAEQDVIEYWDAVQRDRPRYLYGYVSMMEVMARTVVSRSLAPPPSSLKVVITTSEPLFPQQRALLEDAFEVPVRNEYGCGEVGPIAYECEQGSMHLMEQNLWLEVVDDEGRETREGTGELLVTDLTNTAMPLIRYRVGDSVTLGADCECGRAFRTISTVDGRTYDLLEDEQGRRYHGEAVMYILEDLRDRGLDVREVQVLQREPGRARVLFVSPDDISTIARGFEEGFRAGLGGMSITAEAVERIERLRSGKRRIIVREG